MKIRFSDEKNQLLIAERGISFTDVLRIMADGNYLAIVEHPKKFHQRLIVFDWKGYIYYAPFVTEADGNWFLKTIIPSRKLTKQYLGEKQNDKKQEN